MEGPAMATRVATQCDQCGQVDDHPKVHIQEITKHNDCLSVSEKQMVADSSPVAAGIIDACEGGLRGAELLAHIESVHTEQEN
jgi:hypothetical protein